MMTHDRWSVAGVRRIPIRFGEGVRGNVYLPAEVDAPLPVIVWLHPFSYHSGYNEGYGVQGTTVYHRLAAAGYAVIAYDQCGFGLRLLEGRGFYDRNPLWSRLGRMVHDARAALDFVSGGPGAAASPLPELDAERVALLGYSLGGLVALHTAALDDRVTAVAAFSAMSPFRDQSARLATGGTRRLWSDHALLPKLGLFAKQPAETPYDLGDLLRLIGSRRTLLVSPKRDRFADAAAIRRVVAALREAHAAPGLTWQQPEDTNRFQRGQHQEFLAWLRSAWPGTGR
jgi:pimeloyl-ACP methyl ester carboxylesterase